MKLIIAILISVAVFALVRLMYRRHWEEGLKVEIGFGDRVVREGDSSTLLEVITNDKWLPLPLLQVKFAITKTFRFAKSADSDVTDQYYRNEYFALRSYEKISRTYSFTCQKRGLFGMKDMDIVCRDLFMSEGMYGTREHEATLLVLPKRVKMQQIPLESLKFLGEIESDLKLQEDPFAFAMIREYQPYDSMHAINWKVSARMDRLMVNTFRTTMQKELVIFVNLHAHAVLYEEKIREDLIRIAATLCAYFVEKKIPVALVTNGCDCITKEPVRVASGADRSHIRTLESALARIDTTLPVPDITDLIREREAMNRREEFLLLSNDRREGFLEKVDRMRSSSKLPWHLLLAYLHREGRPQVNGKVTMWEISDV